MGLISTNSVVVLGFHTLGIKIVQLITKQSIYLPVVHSFNKIVNILWYLAGSMSYQSLTTTRGVVEDVWKDTMSVAAKSHMTLLEKDQPKNRTSIPIKLFSVKWSRQICNYLRKCLLLAPCWLDQERTLAIDWHALSLLSVLRLISK